MRIKVSGNIAEIIAPFQQLGAGGIMPLREGLYEGGDKVRTRVRRALKKQTGVSAYSTITQNVEGIRSGMSYLIKTDRGGLPIKLFPVSAPGSVSASPWGVSRTFKRSFVKAGGKYMARISSKRLPVRSLYGASLKKEIVKDASLAAFDAGVKADIAPMIEKRLKRFFGG